ncbi:hypothetical protein LI90_438 [Carbonactinospora thermoautotrophica]|uniref:Uncharacterized protein n=1 Tax=Carbonactinospora thermoautotrophica TaxID=1469144 RepID=A0A132MM64_9ACTN|nr:hypothetical protein [Carbonactinospora thermoautotrophica]KWW98809.1 hypothetical protein LI90_438 [Carbonactinospora thermoautotrophica]
MARDTACFRWWAHPAPAARRACGLGGVKGWPVRRPATSRIVLLGVR